MRCKEIMDIIESVYPKDAALGFDNVGLQAGRQNKEIKKVYLALDATEKVIADSIQKETDMLITHHPLIFSPLKAVTDEDFVSRRILTMIQNDMCYYAMHTNYDVLGMAALAGEKFRLAGAEVLDQTMEAGNVPEGIGRIGELEEPMSLEECCGFVKKCLKLEQVQVFGDLSHEVKRLAVSPGSGKSAVIPAIRKGADVLVTGDIGHHDGLDALEQGLCVIDAGQYGTASLFIEDMKHFLQEHCPELWVETAEVKVPFQIV